MQHDMSSHRVDHLILLDGIILDGAALQLNFRVMSTGRRAGVGTFQTAEEGGGKDCVIVVRSKKGASSSGG